MNVFLLDEDPELCAQYHCDKHIVKMILEYTQLISNVYYLNPGKGPVIFKPGWLNHPATRWAEQNLFFLINLKDAVCDEYTYRYGKEHKYNYAYRIYNFPYPRVTNLNCMPKECIISSNSIDNYRNYYMTHKRHIAKWKKRNPPPWWK